MVRTKCAAVLNDNFSVKIDGELFRIKIAEDSHGPLRIVLNQTKNSDELKEESSSSSEEDWGSRLDCNDSEFEFNQSNESIAETVAKGGREADVTGIVGFDRELLRVSESRGLSEQKNKDRKDIEEPRMEADVWPSVEVKSADNKDLLRVPGVKGPILSLSPVEVDPIENFFEDTFFKNLDKVKDGKKVLLRGKKVKSIYDFNGPLSGKKHRPKKKLLDPGNQDRVEHASASSSGKVASCVKSSLHGEKEADSFSAGGVLCCESVSDADLVNCNDRFWENVDSNVGNKVWNAISKLGIVSSGAIKDYSRKIQELETGALVKKYGKKVHSNLES